MTARFGTWLDERLGWRRVWEAIFLRKVPKVNWLYTLGSGALFLAGSQVVPRRLPVHGRRTVSCLSGLRLDRLAPAVGSEGVLGTEGGHAHRRRHPGDRR